MVTPQGVQILVHNLDGLLQPMRDQDTAVPGTQLAVLPLVEVLVVFEPDLLCYPHVPLDRGCVAIVDRGREVRVAGRGVVDM